MGLKKTIEPHFEPALAGDPQHVSGMLEAMRPFVVDHLRFRIKCPDSWVEDIAQETLIGVWKAVKRGDLRYNGVSRCVYRTARNKYIDWYRWYYFRNVNYTDVTEIPQYRVAVMPDFPVEPISTVVGMMSEKQRVVYGLVYERGLSMKEVAGETGRSLGAIKKTTHAIREKCRLHYSP